MCSKYKWLYAQFFAVHYRNFIDFFKAILPGDDRDEGPMKG